MFCLCWPLLRLLTSTQIPGLLQRGSRSEKRIRLELPANVDDDCKRNQKRSSRASENEIRGPVHSTAGKQTPLPQKSTQQTLIQATQQGRWMLFSSITMTRGSRFSSNGIWERPLSFKIKAVTSKSARSHQMSLLVLWPCLLKRLIRISTSIHLRDHPNWPYL